MSLTRRRFIETASLTMLATAALPAGLAQSAAKLSGTPFDPEKIAVLDGVSELTFKPFIGEGFAVIQANRKIGSLTLLSVTSAGSAPESPQAQSARSAPKHVGAPITSFSLRFKGSGAPLPQATYTLDQDSLGTFPLFLVPAGPGVNPQTYTATFTLLD
jgi:hypothetical protein